MTTRMTAPAERLLHRQSGRNALALALAACALAAPARAAVHVVGPPAIGPDFTSLQAAIDAAADGDTLLIDVGVVATHIQLIDKSLRLVGIHGKPRIEHLTVRNLAASRSVSLENLYLDKSWATGLETPGLELRNNAGLVVARDCGNSHSDSGTLGASISACTAVVLVDVDFEGSTLWAGLYVGDSSVWLHGSTIRGGRGNFNSWSNPPGEAGLAQVGGTVHAFGSAIHGGNGDEFYDPSTHLLEGTAGGPAVALWAAAEFRHQDCSIVPGVYGGWFPYPTPPQFVGNSSPTAVPGIAAELDLDSPALEGSTIGITARGAPFAPALLFVGAAKTLTEIPGGLGALALGLGPGLFAVSMPALPATGELTFGAALPLLPAGIDAVSIDAQTLLLPSGGSPACSNPAPLTVVRASL